ncbi:general substrate transporter [Aspergillus ruber CBS 135680]|uniref:General substrate transporter n=1 Tax=Aspergillus ruber (strain CBS 135680) TaxID=1388766 RepID=A0A017SCD1_ASPRC|nr:general substrate transporter [Aspergillus ruber CBS 135680]EYE94446.1 general substrate transporter [Aspergillus ruber CBS 135680]
MQGERIELAQIFLVACPSFILFGYNQSGVGGLVDFPTTGAQKSHNATVQGAVIASYTIDALFGSLICTWIGDILGRHRTIFTGALIALIGQALECTAYALAQFTVGRVILGFGVGMLAATVPVWQSECASPNKRGRNVVLAGMFIAFGFSLTQWVNFGFFQIQEQPTSWRGSLTIPTLFSFIIMSSIFFLSESPRLLVLRNRSDSAQQSLASLRGKSITSPEVLNELHSIETSLEESSHSTIRLRDVFSKNEDKLLYRFLCITLQFFQQMSGGTLISIYTPTIFQGDLDLSARMAKILAACALSWKFLSCFVGFFIIDRVGRRAAFMISGGGMGLCMVAMAVSTSFIGNHTASIISALFVFIYNFFLPLGFLGINFLYPAEIAPARLRVAVQSISTANQWLWMFVVAMVTPTAIAQVGYQYYIVYAVISLIIPPSVCLFYPETKNRSLEEVDQIFRESTSISDAMKASRKLPIQNDVSGGLEGKAVV